MFKQARSRDMVPVLVYTKAHSAKHLLTIITMRNFRFQNPEIDAKSRVPGFAYRRYGYGSFMRAHGARALRARHNWKARDPRFVMILVSAFYSIVQLLYGHFKPGFRRFGDNLR